MTYLQQLQKSGFNNSQRSTTTAAHNFNDAYKNNNISINPKIIIVGTFTPKEGRNNGFFYSSNKNKMFEYINNARNTNLKKPKGRNNKTIVQDLSFLQQERIMFLDVVEYNYDSQNLSAKDDDICFDSLDYKAFKNYLNKDILFICNSHNAYKSFLKILDKYNIKNAFKGQYVYVPQIYRRSPICLQQQWKDALDLTTNKQKIYKDSKGVYRIECTFCPEGTSRGCANYKKYVKNVSLQWMP